MLQKYKLPVLKRKMPEKNGRKILYDTYIFTKKEWTLYGIQSIGIVTMLGRFFYGSVKWAVLLSPLVIVLLKRKQKELCKKRKSELLNQFKDMLVSLNNSLQAGYSLENALLETYKDMFYLRGENSLIVKELAFIKSGIRNGRTPEEMLEDLGERSCEEDIFDLANILTIGKKSGGNMNEIIKSGVLVIEEKIEIKQEIQTLLSAKKLESRIMSVIPFFIILYIGITSKGYFDTLYQTMGGHFFMTVCLLVYLAAVFFAGKIVEIEV